MEHTAVRRAKKARARKAERALRRSSAKKHLLAWESRAALQVQQRGLVSRTVGRLQHKAKQRVWDGWVVCLRTQSKQTVAVKEAQRRILAARVIPVFSAWSSFNKMLLLRKLRIGRSLARIHRHILANVLGGWGGWAAPSAVCRRRSSEASSFARRSSARASTGATLAK